MWVSGRDEPGRKKGERVKVRQLNRETIEVSGLTVTFKLEDGDPIEDADYVVDAFAASIGRANTARHPLRFDVGDPDTGSTYSVECVD